MDDATPAELFSETTDVKNLVKFEKAINEWIQNCGQSGAFLKYLKATVAVFEYLASPEVSGRLRNELEDVRDQLVYIETRLQTSPSSSPKGLVNAWDKFKDKQFRTMEEYASKWIKDGIASVAARNTAKKPKSWPTVRSTLDTLEYAAGHLPKIKYP
ncbi:hypothetical protein PRZ48_011705 [Zasmidium cellare]|uniref:Uncharacterized protein n=1 Tax=Zasmidium cellare TaxID=395010 RepID=A0ABR0E738_ZASCE|nr:hypothetical protein PRZ48_011705 [Zasmidium cellare]